MESPRTLLQTQAPDGASVGPQLVLGRYRLLERLGAGGFGVVWRAHDELLQREVAVKRILLESGGDPEHAERAAREAQAAARLSHPAIVALYEACAQGEAFYLISELVRGQTLGRLIASGELEDEEVLEIGLDLIDALEHAHERGVIHRDIKPQNVLVPDAPAARTAGGRPVAAKLTDFGGASIAEEDALTRTGDVLGTLAYMAPEQSEGREIGEQADLYSLALVLYEGLSGENPVRGATPAATARRIGTPLAPLGRVRRDLALDLTGALDDAIRPDPDQRGTLEDLREALEEALELGLDAPPRRILRARRGSDRAATAPAAAEPGAIPAAPHRDDAHAGPERTALRTLRRPRTRFVGAPADVAVGARDAPPDEQPEQDGALAGGRRARRAAGPEPDHGGLPRTLWIALALAAVAWLGISGRPGAGLLLAAALAPLAAMPPEPYSRRVSPVWLLCLLAPALGVIGLAGAYPAVAGQARRWRARLLLGALGYWWLLLAEPLLGRRLWLGAHAGAPARAVWEGSLTSAASHVLGPLLSMGSLLGAALWALAALLLPWIVRGAHAALDLLAATVWSAALCAAAPALDAGLLATGSHPSPRGALLGAVLGALFAIGARALRGPV